jgi:hypothetical protein
MGIGFSAEPLRKMRERYPKALEDVYDAESINLGVMAPPGDQRKHVFDFHDGIRIVVSRDSLLDGRFLHVRGAIKKVPESARILDHIRDRGLSHPPRFVRYLLRRLVPKMDALCGRLGNPATGELIDGVLHFYYLEQRYQRSRNLD